MAAPSVRSANDLDSAPAAAENVGSYRLKLLCNTIEQLIGAVVSVHG